MAVCSESVEAALGDLEDYGQSPVVLSDGSRALGVLGVADEIREGATESLAALYGLGIRPLMILTGDMARPRGRSSRSAQKRIPITTYHPPSGRHDVISGTAP